MVPPPTPLALPSYRSPSRWVSMGPQIPDSALEPAPGPQTTMQWGTDGLGGAWRDGSSSGFVWGGLEGCIMWKAGWGELGRSWSRGPRPAAAGPLGLPTQSRAPAGPVVRRPLTLLRPSGCEPPLPLVPWPLPGGAQRHPCWRRGRLHTANLLRAPPHRRVSPGPQTRPRDPQSSCPKGWGAVLTRLRNPQPWWISPGSQHPAQTPPNFSAVTPSAPTPGAGRAVPPPLSGL